jgi:hypothetical protein
MINEEILSEKLKYLISSDLATYFNVMEFYLHIDYVNNKESIERYEISIKFDYLGIIDFSVDFFCRDIKNMVNKLRDSITKYVISPKGKIILSSDNNFSANGGLILDMKFVADSEHIVTMIFTVSPEPE